MSEDKDKNLEHLIEETINKALLEEHHSHAQEAEHKHEGKTMKVKKIEKKSLKIPGVRKEDGSECCGGGCCFEPDKSEFVPELSKKEYLEIINQVLDPETGVGIADMGLIYDVEEEKDGTIKVTMTLTSLGCPAGGQITTEIDATLRLQPHVTDVRIDVVWEPSWHPDMMNPEVKAMLFGNNEPWKNY
jgi:metal-sulfur cluster biosynthetic enzyme